MPILIAAVAVFFAMNMGVSGFSVAFAPSYGSNILNRKQAAVAYGACVILGALLLGPRVAQTLTGKIACGALSPVSGGLILVSGAATMFLSNILRVPQSTSFITVASFTGAGLYYGKVNWATLGKIIFIALIFSLASILITVAVKRRMYPPRPGNLGFYEKCFVHRNAIRKFVIAHDMYAGFSVGTNNVANVIAPLMIVQAAKINPIWLILLFAPFFGIGAYWAGGRVLNTVSKEIIHVGEFSATIVSFITATFVLTASLLGLPTPYAQFTTFALLGVSCVKDGCSITWNKMIVKRILWVWILVPLFAVLLSFALHSIMGVKK